MTTGKKDEARAVGYLTTVEAAKYLGVSTQFLEAGPDDSAPWTCVFQVWCQRSVPRERP